MPMETHCAFTDAKASFVNGQHVSATVLATAFVDHWLTMHIASHGFFDESSWMLARRLRFAAKRRLVPEVLVDKIDDLRRIRNPFVHIPKLDHSDSLTRRATRKRVDLWGLMHEDAKEAMITMHAVALYEHRQPG